MSTPPPIPLDDITALCKRHGVNRLWLFGSAATGEFDPATSDYDFLVEFAPGERRGLDDRYFLFVRDLEVLLGRRVDLAEVGTISNPFVLASVEASKVALYAAA